MFWPLFLFWFPEEEVVNHYFKAVRDAVRVKYSVAYQYHPKERRKIRYLYVFWRAGVWEKVLLSRGYEPIPAESLIDFGHHRTPLPEVMKKEVKRTLA